MQNLVALYDRVDIHITRWMARYGVLLLRVSLGVIFLWFGFLKYFPDLSAAEGLAARTVVTLSFGLVPTKTLMLILATWECLIGFGLLTGRLLRTTLFLLFMQMIGTVTPIFLFPQELFRVIPYAPTLEGQYIVKNLVLISAGLVIGATVRGRRDRPSHARSQRSAGAPRGRWAR